jgi:hypothetical protein
MIGPSRDCIRKSSFRLYNGFQVSLLEKTVLMPLCVAHSTGGLTRRLDVLQFADILGAQ